MQLPGNGRGPVPDGPVLLIEPPITPITVRFGLSALATYPPLTQVRLAGQMPEEDVRVVDLRLPGQQRVLEEVLRSEPPAAVGISATFSSNGEEAIRVAATVRRISPGSVIVIGGSAASEDPDGFLSSDADLICHRRGDVSFPELVRSLRRERTLEEPPAGFFHRDEAGRWRKGPEAPNPLLETLRPNAWHLLPPAYWRRYVQGFRPTGMTQTSEGCPYDCSFCSVWVVHGRQVSVASLDNVKHDLECLPPYAGNLFLADDIWMQASEPQKRQLYDPLLDWMASDYRKRRPNLGLTVETRTDLFLRERARFKDWTERGGLKKIFFGIEAVTDEQLRAYSKRVSVDRNSDAIRLAAGMGVYIVAQLVIPPEADEAYFDEIVKFLEAHRGLIRAANFTIATPLPGTVLYREVVKTHPELADRSIVRHPAFSLYTALTQTRLGAEAFYHQMARIYGAAAQVRWTSRGTRVFFELLGRTPWLLGHVIRMPLALKRLKDPQTFLDAHMEVQGRRLWHPTHPDTASGRQSASAS